jgi:hypothetical protein
MRRRLTILTALIAVLAVFAGQPAAAAELATYSARYKLVLQELNIPGEARAWDGAAAIRIARDCRKWSVQLETAFTLSLGDGGVFRLHSVEKYRESLDGTRLEFELLLKINGSVSDRRKGVAVLAGRGKPGRATFSVPKGKTVDLPAGTELPMAGMASLVANLARGETQWRQSLFMWGELMTMSHSVDGKGVSLAKQPKGDTRLTKFSGWRVSSTAQRHETGGTLRRQSLVHPNGLTSQYLTEQELVTYAHELVEIRALPTPEC